MKLELTGKDLLLIRLSLSVLTVFLCLRFVLMPGLEMFQESVLQSDEQQQTAQEMQAAIDGISSLERRVEQEEADLKALCKDYYEPMENREIDELLTGIALKHGLFPVSLSIEGAVAEIPQPYPYSASVPPETPASENCIYTARGRIVLSGEESDLFDFVGDVEENYPSIQLRALSRQERTYFDSEWNAVDQTEMSCEIAVYIADREAVPPAADKAAQETESQEGV